MLKKFLTFLLCLIFFLGPVAAQEQVSEPVEVLDDYKFGLNITPITNDEGMFYNLTFYRKDTEFNGYNVVLDIPLRWSGGNLQKTKLFLGKGKESDSCLIKSGDKTLILRKYRDYGLQFPYLEDDGLSDRVFELKLTRDMRGYLEYEFSRKDHKKRPYFVKLHQTMTIQEYPWSQAQQFEFNIGLNKNTNMNHGKINTNHWYMYKYATNALEYGLQFKK